MANDNVCALGAATRDVGNSAPSRVQDCSDVVHISVFFDGTGNNKNVDEEKHRWSNPARIWQAARMFVDLGSTNAYAIYISGVGTPFNGKPLTAAERNDISVEDGRPGGVAGAGGSRRLDFGQQQINDALRSVLLSNAKTLGGKVAKYATAGQQQSFADVSKSLAEHRLVKQINVSIFGFSRGAALARAFCNQWLWQCNQDHEQLSYHGIPIRFAFLGLFDTVASFGIPSTNAANWVVGGGFKGRDLVVDSRVERCVHYVAGHELRFAFPVDLIRRDGKTNGNWLERVYPGVHSDVGGGYEPLKDGKANRDNQGIDNNYARIPMRDMMNESVSCGVRILGYPDLAANKDYKALFAERFECKPDTEKAYQAYRAVCHPSGTIEHQIQQHMAQLYSAYGSIHRQGKRSLTQREHGAGQSWALGPNDMASELKSYYRTQAKIEAAAQQPDSEAMAGYITAMGLYAMWIEPAQWQLDAWKRNASAGVVTFIDRWVHDSKVGFLNNAEPFSYFSKRGVSESSHSVHGWFEESISRPFGKAYDATADAAKRAEKYVARKSEEAYDATVDAAKKTEKYVANKAEQAYDATVDAAKKTGNYVADKATQAYDAASNAASQAVQKGGQVLGDATNAVSSSTQEALNYLKGAWVPWGH